MGGGGVFVLILESCWCVVERETISGVERGSATGVRLLVYKSSFLGIPSTNHGSSFQLPG